MKISVNLSIIVDAPEAHANEILDGDMTALLSTIYAPSDSNGKWWVQGESTVKDNGMKIVIK